MPQTISNSQPDEQKPGEIATNLRRAKQNDLLNGQDKSQRLARERRRQGLLRQMENKKMAQESRLNLLKRLAELEEEDKKNKPKTTIEEFGPEPNIPAEGTAESTMEKPVPAEIGRVPMEQKKDELPPQEDANAPLEQLPQKMEIGEPTRPEATKGGEPGGGPIKTDVEPGPFSKAGPLKAGTGEPEKPGAEKPGEEKAGEKPGEKTPPETPRTEKETAESAKTPPSEGAQAAKISGAQMAGRNKALAGGVEGALAEAAGLPPSVTEVISVWKKYKWFVWAAGIIAPLIIPILIGLLIGLTLFFIVFLTIYYMDNNPGVTFMAAIRCGGAQLLGGDGFSCLVKEAIKKVPAAVNSAVKQQ